MNKDVQAIRGFGLARFPKSLFLTRGGRKGRAGGEGTRGGYSNGMIHKSHNTSGSSTVAAAAARFCMLDNLFHWHSSAFFVLSVLGTAEARL